MSVQSIGSPLKVGGSPLLSIASIAQLLLVTLHLCLGIAHIGLSPIAIATTRVILRLTLVVFCTLEVVVGLTIVTIGALEVVVGLALILLGLATIVVVLRRNRSCVRREKERTQRHNSKYIPMHHHNRVF